jgi:hypothetical protein
METYLSPLRSRFSVSSPAQLLPTVTPAVAPTPPSPQRSPSPRLMSSEELFPPQPPHTSLSASQAVSTSSPSRQLGPSRFASPGSNFAPLGNIAVSASVPSSQGQQSAEALAAIASSLLTRRESLEAQLDDVRVQIMSDPRSIQDNGRLMLESIQAELERNSSLLASVINRL